VFGNDIRAAFMLASDTRVERAFLYYAPIDRAHFDLALVWLLVREHAAGLGCDARVALMCPETGRSVMVNDPPLSRAERARSDDAHADTILEALDMLTR
jgi:hypothetical protein